MKILFTVFITIFLSFSLFAQDARINQVGYQADQQNLRILFSPLTVFM